MKAVVLLSGGLDSYTAGAMVARRRLRAVRLDGPLRAGPCARDRGGAAVAAAWACRGTSNWMSTRDDRRIGARRRRRDSEGPRRSTTPDIPSTYVPARNTIFLSLAMAWAEVVGARPSSSASTRSTTPAIPIAGRSTSRRSSGSRRWRPSRRRRPAAARSWRRCCTSRRPTSSAAVSRSGCDYGLTLSCYDPGADGRPCGHCDSCRLRAGASPRRASAAIP